MDLWTCLREACYGLYCRHASFFGKNDPLVERWWGSYVRVLNRPGSDPFLFLTRPLDQINLGPILSPIQARVLALTMGPCVRGWDFLLTKHLTVEQEAMIVPPVGRFKPARFCSWCEGTKPWDQIFQAEEAKSFRLDWITSMLDTLRPFSDQQPVIWGLEQVRFHLDQILPDLTTLQVEALLPDLLPFRNTTEIRVRKPAGRDVKHDPVIRFLDPKMYVDTRAMLMYHMETHLLPTSPFGQDLLYGLCRSAAHNPNRWLIRMALNQTAFDWLLEILAIYLKSQFHAQIAWRMNEIISILKALPTDEPIRQKVAALALTQLDLDHPHIRGYYGSYYQALASTLPNSDPRQIQLLEATNQCLHRDVVEDAERKEFRVLLDLTLQKLGMRT